MSHEIDLRLGLRVRRRRRLLGLSQKVLAARCGLRPQQIQKYESAANKMSAVIIGRLAHALDVPVGYFYEGLEGLMGPDARPTPARALGQRGGEEDQLRGPSPVF